MDIILGALAYLIFVGVLIYSIINPRKTFMLGRRWQYKNDVEPNEEALFIHRLIPVIILILLTFIFITSLIYQL